MTPIEKSVTQSMPAFTFDAKELALDTLLLDPNNYRFLNGKKFKKKVATRFHEKPVQDATLQSLENSYNLDDLKQSILTNGYVPMERIIVVPYKPKAGLFLIVEGNRRVASLKSLLKENLDGSTHLTSSQKKSFRKIPCVVLTGQGITLKHLERVIMGIRHIAGPKEWGAYQQAILVSELKDDEGLDFSEIAEMLGISNVEAARRYRAIGALKTMEGDELYAKKAEPDFYRLFHELVSVPEVRKRFGWSSDNHVFEDIEKARQFFDLISSDGKRDPKIQSYSDVRKLRSVVDNAAAEDALFDPETSLKKTFEIAELGKKPERVSSLLNHVKATLAQIGIAQTKEIKSKELSLIAELIALLKSLQKMSQK